LLQGGPTGPGGIKYQQPTPTNARIAKLKKEGLTLEEIGNRVGMTRQGVHWRLKKYNPELLERNLDERNRQIMERREHGLTYQQIGKEFGLTKQHIVRVVRRNTK
jgi:DNA-directed RNA polymerase specialized sigma subunit